MMTNDGFSLPEFFLEFDVMSAGFSYGLKNEIS